MRKFIVFLSVLIFSFSFSSLVFAQDSTIQDQDLIVQHSTMRDLNEIDLSEPYYEVNEYVDENGNIYTITNEFEPIVANTKGTSTENASVGTWTTSYNGIVRMSFKWDLTKSGSSWKISNAREHLYSAPLSSFQDPVLEISRSLSTSSFPAEVYATVQANMIDGYVYSSTWLLRASVSQGGIVTTYWN